MSRRASQVKLRKINGDYYLIPKDWDFKKIKAWYKRLKKEVIEVSDIEVLSLQTRIDNNSFTVSEIIERGTFDLTKPRPIV